MLTYLFVYLSWTGILVRRLYIFTFRITPTIRITTRTVEFPDFYFGIKTVFLDDIYSVEDVVTASGDPVLVLGIKNRKTRYIDRAQFATKGNFDQFRQVLVNSVAPGVSPGTGEAAQSVRTIAVNKSTRAVYGIALVAGCLYLFGAWAGSAGNAGLDYVSLGGASGATYADGEMYRIFSAPFIHANPVHLLLNILAIGVLGEAIEKTLASIRFLNIFLLSCLSGGIFFLVFSDDALGIGASGGVYGIFGAYLYLQYRFASFLPGSISFIPARSLAVLLFVFFGTEVLFLRNVGISAHLGGLLAGFAYLACVNLGGRLELAGHATLPEKGLCGLLIFSFVSGLVYFVAVCLRMI